MLLWLMCNEALMSSRKCIILLNMFYTMIEIEGDPKLIKEYLEAVRP